MSKPQYFPYEQIDQHLKALNIIISKRPKDF